LGIVINEIIGAREMEKGKIIARAMQNVKIAKKAKLNVRFVGGGLEELDKRDVFSLGLVLGMNTKMAEGAAEGFLKLSGL
jgi:hypothetical protein